MGVDGDAASSSNMRLFERNSAAGCGGEELSSIFDTLIDNVGGSSS